jgi:hypothetical protein
MTKHAFMFPFNCKIFFPKNLIIIKTGFHSCCATMPPKHGEQEQKIVRIVITSFLVCWALNAMVLILTGKISQVMVKD